MRPFVVEAGVALLAGAGARPVVPVGRPRRRGRAVAIEADAAVAAIETAGPGVVVLGRPTAADPGAACIARIARLLGVPCVRLPEVVEAAAWVVAVAAHPEFGDERLVRRLEVLAGSSRPAPRLPSLRPGVLARWAGCAWRPCARCGGGGPPGGPCGRCGARALGVPA